LVSLARLRDVSSLAFTAALVSAACGSSAPADDPFKDCPSFTGPPPNLPPGSNGVSGTFNSATLRAVMCPGGAFAEIVPNTPDLLITNPNPFLFLLADVPRLTGSPSTPANDRVLVQYPSVVTSFEVLAQVGLPAATPGTYSGGCGETLTSAKLAAPTTPNDIQDFGWLAATGPNDCDGIGTPEGSWTLTINSVGQQVPVSAGHVASAPHGTFAGTLPAAQASSPDAPSMTVWLTF
jgi:hypothetical protein